MQLQVYDSKRQKFCLNTKLYTWKSHTVVVSKGNLMRPLDD
jgi:hypothetical protein